MRNCGLVPFVTVVVSSVFFAISSGSEPNAFPSGKVGIYGAQDRMLIHGCKTFKADEVRAALLGDWEVQLASAPSGALDVYVSAIRRQLRFGYLAAGFADARVSVGADEEHETIVADVTEGTRYRYGAIRITGNHAISSDTIVKYLRRTSNVQSISSTVDAEGIHYGMDVTSAPDEDTWEAGQFADISPSHIVKLTQFVKNVYWGAGYFWSEVQVSTPVEGGDAVCLIDVNAEGPQATLGVVKINGMKSERYNEVMRFLDLHEGEPIGIDQLYDAQLKLWQCGRFKKHLMTVAPADERGRRAVTLDHEEFPGLPPLDQPLPAMDQGLLKFREWILSRAAAGEDLVMKYAIDGNGNYFDGVFGPGGTAVRIHYKVPGHGTQGTTQPTTVPSFLLGQGTIDLGAVFSADRIGVYSFSSGRKLVSINKPSLGLNLKAKMVREMKNAHETKLSFAFSWTMTPDSDNPGMQIVLSLAPGAFVEMAHDADTHCAMQGGIITVSGKTDSCRIDAKTGRLIDGKIGGMELSARPHALIDETAVLERAHPGRNSLDQEHPIASAAGFLSEEIVLAALARSKANPEDMRLTEALTQLISTHVLEPVDRLYSQRTMGHDFFIPGDLEFMRSANPMGNMALSVAIPLCDGLFDRGSWPWVLGREETLIFAGRTENLGPELDRVVRSNKIGPLGKYLTSLLVSQFNKEGSAAVAVDGLHDLKIKAFDKDVAVLTQGDGASAEILRRFCDVLRKLPAEDVDALLNKLTPEYEAIARHFVTALRSHADETIDKALPDALDDIWPDMIHAALQSALQTKVPGA
jgi:hypothetical protein